jgi:hypothetical protein
MTMSAVISGHIWVKTLLPLPRAIVGHPVIFGHSVAGLTAFVPVA